jgi:hypothetical protein
MPTVMKPSFVAKRNECGLCFPIMHPTEVSFDETDFLCEVLCVFSECFVWRHSTLQWIGDASRSNVGLYDEKYMWAGQ